MNIINPSYGQRISTDTILIRKHETRIHKNQQRLWAYWGEVDQSIIDGVFLGFRTLRNGWIERLGHGEGDHFRLAETVKVALISPDEHQNPVYARPPDFVTLF